MDLNSMGLAYSCREQARTCILAAFASIRRSRPRFRCSTSRTACRLQYCVRGHSKMQQTGGAFERVGVMHSD
eukprot:SAG22_NODE_1182_length_5233_cov_12.254188_7_plen_72_part_00